MLPNVSLLAATFAPEGQLSLTAVERLPRAVAGHAFAAADALDRHGIGFLEWGTQRLLFALARMGMGLERLLVALEQLVLRRSARASRFLGLRAT